MSWIADLEPRTQLVGAMQAHGVDPAKPADLARALSKSVETVRQMLHALYNDGVVEIAQGKGPQRWRLTGKPIPENFTHTSAVSYAEDLTRYDHRALAAALGLAQFAPPSAVGTRVHTCNGGEL